MIGMYVALDSYIKRDHNKEWKMWEDRIAVINNSVKNIPGVTTEVIVPAVANHSPSLMIAWDNSKIKLTKESLAEKLRNGKPSIETVSWEKDNSIRVTVFMLKPRQEKIVAARIKEELVHASV
jgi:L-seryl-tRNA(Ser) seleniumtransferase